MSAPFQPGNRCWGRKHIPSHCCCLQQSLALQAAPLQVLVLPCAWAAALLTSTHQVIPEEGDSEPDGQHHQVRSESREQLRKPSCLGAEIQEGAGHQDAVGMEANQVVLPRVQLRRFHQLEAQLPMGRYRYDMPGVGVCYEVELLLE